MWWVTSSVIGGAKVSHTHTCEPGCHVLYVIVVASGRGWHKVVSKEVGMNKVRVWV